MNTEVYSQSLKLSDLAIKYVNPATQKPYSDRMLRIWSEQKMGFKIVDNAVNSTQASLIEAYYNEVIVGRRPLEEFKHDWADKLDSVKEVKSYVGAKRVEQNNDSIRQQVDLGDAEDAIYGALVPVTQSLKEDIQAVDNACTALEQKAAIVIHSRIKPGKIRENVVAYVLQLTDEGESVEDVEEYSSSIIDAISDALNLDDLPQLEGVRQLSLGAGLDS